MSAMLHEHAPELIAAADRFTKIDTPSIGYLVLLPVFIVIGAALIAWAVTRPIVVDERELEADKAAAERQGKPAAH